MLHNIRVASPCSADWNKMEGDDRVRFCSACQLNVYNFSEMTEREVRQLIQNHEGRRLCGRLYRRKDGTILTRNCPVGLRAVVRSISRVAGIVLSFMTPIFSAGQIQANAQSSQPQSHGQNAARSTGLKIHVVDVSGEFLDSADVLLKQEGSRKQIRGTTDKHGDVFFPAFSNGAYLVKVKSGRYQIYKKRRQLHGGQTISLRVNVSASIPSAGIIAITPIPRPPA